MSCVAVLAGSPALALGGSSPVSSASPAGEGSGASSSLGDGPSPLVGALVIAGSPMQGEQLQAGEEARRDSPEVRIAREKSRTAFAGLNAGAAAKLAREAFPGVVDDRAGGPPQLPAGQKIVSYPTDNAAQVELGGGKHAVIESTQPLAIETSPGHREPIDLSLGEAGGAFQPARSRVGLHIPKRLADGVQLTGTGVSLTPVDASGSPLSGSEGAVDGASVLYANTQTDTDSLIKPTTDGFDADTLLRSVDSPQRLYFRVGLPTGAKLVQAKYGSGVVNVVKGGTVIATVLPPSAQDAAGTSIPVAMSVAGDTITLVVDDRAREYQFPIDVDPPFNDEQLTGATKPTRWKFCANGSTKCEKEKVYEEGPFKSSGWGGTEDLTLKTTGTYHAKENGYLEYQTQGESKILEASISSSGKNTGNIETALNLSHLNGSEEVDEDSRELAAAGHEYGKSNWGVCDDYYVFKECIGGEANAKYAAPHNVAKLEQSATAEGSGENIATLYTANVEIYQENGPEEPKFNTTSPTLYNGHAYVQNVLYKNENKPEDWLSEDNGAFEVKTKDPGVGISYFGVSVGAWVKRNELFKEGKCEGIQCPPEFNQTFTYNKEMSNGEVKAGVTVQDGIGYYGPGLNGTIKVDGTLPYDLALTGLPSSGVINEAQYHLHAQALDGTAPTPSSGIKSLELGLEGFTLPGKSGSCTPGPCSATGEWTINGEALGAGKHTLTLVATDYAGTVEKKEYTITVRHAGALPVGPGAVDPITGAFRLGASDVSLSGGRGSLGVSRSYNSRQLTEGEQGPFGPQWSISVSGSQTVEQESTGNVVLVSSNGERTIFESNGKGGYISPKGDENLVLEAEKEGETIKAYLLKTPASGTTVKYVQPGGVGPWVISSSEGSLTKTSGEKETVEWERVENVTRPSVALAPAPKGVTCNPTFKSLTELNVGCRALVFEYAKETSATGDAPSEWGAYKGRLTLVGFAAYNPTSKDMQDPVVAEYLYDKQGRLRAEWDPRIATNTDCGGSCSALKTTYGYDSEGHVVSVNPAGQEPWLLHYGTTANDTSPGRLLSVTRPPAGTSTQVKEQNEKAAPEDTAVPTLSNTSPVIGTTLSISSNGTWSNSPLAYSDAWEDCYTYESKETCNPIPGAVNSTYTPQARDAGYKLRAQVTAVNADGATVATTAASNALAGVAPKYKSQFGKAGEGEGQFKGPAGDAVMNSSGNVWVVDHGNNRVEEWSATGTLLHTYGKKGTGSLQFESPEGIAINQGTGNVYVADKGNNRIEELNSKGEYVGAFGEKGSELGKLSSPVGVAVAPNGSVWVADYGNNRVDEFTESGGYLGSFGKEGSENGQFKGPTGIAFSGENAYVVDSGNDRVQEFSMSGQYVAKFGTKGTGSNQFETPYGIATEPVSGDLYVADSGNNCIQEFNPAGVFVITYGKKGEGTNGEFSGPAALAFNSAGDAYVADTGNNRLQELEPKYSTNNPLPEAPALGTSSVSTIDYNIPISGAGAPHEMTKVELEKWGQTDDPAEPVPGEPLATAIFPPDEPMGWPAKDFKRASISYYDELGRKVNQASPSGGIATSEYNETNEVVRSLSADNRAAALNEGSKSKETSELLDTKSKYNGETTAEKEAEEKAKDVEPGTRLLEVRGPQHTVKLVSGSEVKARNHVKYYYDEGAPGGETFDLVTKTTDGAEYEGKEADVRTITTSYSGQENLGWLLRKPTSVTTDPSGESASGLYLHITQTTVYDETTGDIVETRAPAADSGGSIGSEGSGNGQLRSPDGVAVAPSGNVYVVDSGNSRIEELTATGEYVTKWGATTPTAIAVSANGNVYVTESGTADRVQEFSPTGASIMKWGSEGTGNGQFKQPHGIAVGLSGNVYVDDTNNDRVQEFSPTGEFITKWGSEGSGNGQFKNPYGVAVAGNGDVYVTDYSNDRVQEFSSSGEYLTKWGSIGSGNGQLLNPYGVAVAANGEVLVGEYGGNRVDEFSSTGVYITNWGSYGAGNGQVKNPSGVAIAATGVLYVADYKNSRIDKFAAFPATPVRFGSMAGQFDEPASVAATPNGYAYYVADAGRNRIQSFSMSGEYLTTWGSYGSENGQFSNPHAVAVAASGDVYVADTGNKRIQEFSPTGAYITKWSVEGSSPEGIAVAANGNVYVADTASNKIEEFTSAGTYVTKWGSTGSESGEFKGPQGIAVATNGNVYVADTGNNRIQEFTSAGTYVTKWGSEGSESGEFKGPQGIAVTAGGDVYVADTGNNRVQEFSATGGEDLAKWGSEGSENGLFKKPEGLAVATSGNVYVADTGNNRIQEFTASGTYTAQVGSEGSAGGQLKGPSSSAVSSGGNIYVADTGNNRIEEFSASGEYLAAWGSEGSGVKQFKSPRGIAVAPNGNVYVSDTGNDRIQEFTSSGTYVTKWGSEGTGNGLFKEPDAVAVAPNGNVYVADAGNDRIQEFTSSGTYVTTWGSSGSENGQMNNPEGLAIAPNGNVFVADTSNNRIQEFSSSGTYVTKWGSTGSGNGQFKEPQGVVVAANGDVYVADTGNSRIQEFASNGEYVTSLGSSGSGYGQLKSPRGLAVLEKSLYIADTGNSRIQKWLLAPNENAHDSQTVYYSAGYTARIGTCDNHPEWANLPCQSEPAAQPGTSGLPELPVTTDIYNMWDEPEAITEKFGSTTRTKTMTYDSAGRLLTNEESSTIDTSLPKVTNEYNSGTGAMVKQSTTVGETIKSIKSVYNTLGQLTEYTDADGNTTQYVYSGPVNDDQVEEVNYGGKKGSQMYSYNSTTKALEKLLDVGPEGGAGAGTFTANYDVEGKMTSETYPNGMTAKYMFNPAGEATGIEYDKTTHCTEKCTWFSETVLPSIHGEALVRTSTLAKEEYAYDSAGRVTEVKETPTGKGCATRDYAYDNESDRTSLTTVPPGTEGECQGPIFGTTETHTYDEANRLIDTGVEYETFGNQTKIPAADAGEHEITASFYVDNQIAVQKQNGETTDYSYDPAGRTEKTVSEGTAKSTVVNHYPGSGEGISWTEEEAGKDWTRNVPGIDGSLAATQHNSEAAVLQLHDLEGNIVATAAVSETETKLLTTYNPTEFGVPVNGTPPTKYSWLGASGISTEQASGAANPGGGGYVPQLGRPLQTEPVESPGGYASGSYGGAPYETYVSAEAMTLGGDWAAGAPEREAGRLAAAKKFEEEEEQKAREEAELRARLNAPVPDEGGAGWGGETEGTIGDPLSCKVRVGGEPYIEEDQFIGHTLHGEGSFECAGPLPAHTYFEICFMEGGLRKMGCKSWATKGESMGEWEIHASCKEGLNYTVEVWLWKVGESAISEMGEFGLCGENEAEVVEGHWL
jgi:DNA-binding beta-propeller fold protein YncE